MDKDTSNPIDIYREEIRVLQDKLGKQRKYIHNLENQLDKNKEWEKETDDYCKSQLHKLQVLDGAMQLFSFLCEKFPESDLRFIGKEPFRFSIFKESRMIDNMCCAKIMGFFAAV